MNKPVRPKVGVLALTLELYETLAPKLRGGREKWTREKVVPALRRVSDVVFDKAVFTRPDVDQAVARLERAGCDAILVLLLTYSPSQVSLPALKRTRLPILVWNTQELHAVDDDFDGAAMTDNHGVHGTQDLCNVLLRSGVKFHYVTSHLDDFQPTAEIEDFLVAAAAAGRLRKARLGLLGYPFPGMGDFAVDTTHMAATLGCTVEQLSLEDYILRAAGAVKSHVASLVKEYRAKYAVAKGVTAADLDATARVELALRGMVKDHDLAGLTYQFMAFGQDERTPTVPFVAASRLLAEGVGFGGEGDVIGAAGTCLLNWLAAPASFTEIFTIDFAGNGLFMSHMGEANVAMARKDGKVSLVARPGPITRTRGRQLALAAGMEAGPATFYALTQGAGNRWRVIASEADIADWGPLPMEVPHFKMCPRGDVRNFLTDYANAGGPHHAAICFGDATRRLELAAKILDADFVKIEPRENYDIPF